MKVLDQMTGLKAASGDPILHIGLLCGALMLPSNLTCHNQDISYQRTLLVASHAFNASRFVLSIFLTQIRAMRQEWQFTADFVERLVGFFGVCLSIWNLIVAQDFYYFNEISPGCNSTEVVLLYNWIFLEVILFYLTFLANFGFIVTSSIWLKGSGIRF